MHSQFQLKFSRTAIPYWASRYDYPRAEADLVALAPTIQSRGYLTKEELKALALWKTPRSAGHVSKNSDLYIKEVTSAALQTPDERFRIQVLTLLDGVQWPTASVVLHLFHPEPYPILDFRALWSVGVDEPPAYDYQFWSEYVAFCRDKSVEVSVEMRTLDQALWQYSKDNQRA